MLQLYWNISGPERLIWLCRSDEQANPDAAWLLGALYEHGSKEITADTIQAYVWYLIAAAAETKNASAYRDYVRVRKSLTAPQLEQAKRALANWAPGQCEQALPSQSKSPTVTLVPTRRFGYS